MSSGERRTDMGIELLVCVINDMYCLILGVLVCFNYNDLAQLYCLSIRAVVLLPTDCGPIFQVQWTSRLGAGNESEK